MSMRYIVIGAGIAGISSCEGIREGDPNGEILLLTEEKGLPYSRPMLTKAPFPSFDPDDWRLRKEDWFREKKILYRDGAAVLSLNKEEKQVRVKYPDGKEEILSYDRLILATGAENFIPPIPGIREGGALRKRIFSIRRPEDIYRIKATCAPRAKAVILGGGVIGIEAALELRRYGAEVQVLEVMPGLLAGKIDREMSSRMTGILEDLGIRVWTGVRVQEIQGEESADFLLLEGGRKLSFDLLIVSCGVRARKELAEQAGLLTNRGILIDQNGRTSDPAIFAAGDAAEQGGKNYALWSQGMEQGRAAGLSAAGNEGVTRPFDTSLVITSPQLSLFAAGDTGTDPEKDYQIRYIEAKDPADIFYVDPRTGSSFEKQFYAGGRLVGTEILGNLFAMEDRKREIFGEGRTQ